MEKVLSASQENTRWLIIWYWLPVLLYAALIFYLSSLPHPEEQLPDFLLKKVSDKLLHFVEYGVLGVFGYRAFRWAAGPAAARHAILLAILAASLYGVSDEIHQAFVPFRESSWLDWVADTIGGAIGAVGASRFLKHDARLNPS
ncbi:MAG TPA: VanZ family protein [Nitrospira sp.]